MASRVFLFFTPSDSSLVRNWFVCKEPRTPVVKLVCEVFQPLFSFQQKLKKLRIQIYMDLRYIDPQARVLNYFYK